MCDEANDDDRNKYPAAADMRERCLSAKNEEFTTCEPAEPITCKNMLSYLPSSTAECRPGCVCKKGYVLDAVSKECVLPNDCSCHHGSQRFVNFHSKYLMPRFFDFTFLNFITQLQRRAINFERVQQMYM